MHVRKAVRKFRALEIDYKFHAYILVFTNFYKKRKGRQYKAFTFHEDIELKAQTLHVSEIHVLKAVYEFTAHKLT